ncbi:MAG: hypothetical protein FWD69_03545 [Polyangiaceae bacterium]|nr:hypothetical protein [Polyangiaceae bacterium]
MNRRNRDAANRFAERRRREDEAPRLHTEVPPLETLKLELEERRSGVASAEVSHIRRVVVATAPALFEVPCSNPSCHDGGHDLTSPVMSALRARSPRFEGEDTCYGQVGNASCERVLKYVATATYRP